MGPLNSTDVLILAGGLGTRLKGLIPENYPKAMTLIAGKPFLDILISKIGSQGVKRVILASGFGADPLIEYAAHLSKKLEIEIVISHETKPLGTAGALKNASSFIKTDPFIVMNGDTFSDVKLDKLIEGHLTKNAEASICLTEISNPDRFGVVQIDAGTSEVTNFLEKSCGAANALISTGVYVFNKSLLDKIPFDTFFSLEREIFPALVGKHLYGFDFCSNFIDIGTPESLQISNHYFGKT